MRVLVISSFPWSPSNRGIDIITSFFTESGFTVTHVVFPYYPHHRKKWEKFSNQKPSGHFKQIYSKTTHFMYSSKYMHRLPQFVKNIIFEAHIQSLTEVVDLKKFDIIVIESGKPVLLHSILPSGKFVIYRQSDPVWLLNPEDSEMIRHELEMCQKSNLILAVRDIFKDMLPEEVKSKTEVWLNGFEATKESDLLSNPYPDGTINAIYLGYTRIDPYTLEIIAKEHPDVNFHIIGSCLGVRDMKRLISKYQNVLFYGNLPPNEYLPYVKLANFAIVPYADLEIVRYVGLNSKFLLFMYYNLPIVSYRTLLLNESTVNGILFASTPSEFSEEVLKAKRMQRVQYNIDFRFYSSVGRKKELKSILEKYLGKIFDNSPY